MKERKGVKLESNSFEEISEEDFELADKTITDFCSLNKKHRNFYVTVFENKRNRKIIFKISGGELKNARIEKIDEDED